MLVVILYSFLASIPLPDACLGILQDVLPHESHYPLKDPQESKVRLASARHIVGMHWPRTDG